MLLFSEDLAKWKKQTLKDWREKSWEDFKDLWQIEDQNQKSKLCATVLMIPGLPRDRVVWAIEQLPYGIHAPLYDNSQSSIPTAAPLDKDKSPLAHALFYQHKVAVDVLLAKGATIGLTEWKALTVKCPQSKFMKWINILWASDPNPSPQVERLLIDQSIARNHIQLTKVLLKKGVDPFEILKDQFIMKKSAPGMEVFRYLVSILAKEQPSVLGEMHNLNWDPLLSVLETSHKTRSQRWSKIQHLFSIKDLKIDVNWKNAKGVSAFSHALTIVDESLVNYLTTKGGEWPDLLPNEEPEAYFSRVSHSWHQRAFGRYASKPFLKQSLTIFTRLQKEALERNTAKNDISFNRSPRL